MISIMYGLLLYLLVARGHLVVLAGFVWALLVSLGLTHSSFSYSAELIFYLHSMPVMMLVLTLLVTVLALITLVNSEENVVITRWLLVLLNLSLVMAFMSSHLLVFYVSFEASLIPIVLMLVLGGAQPERLQAGVYLVMYTAGASLPFLVLLLLRRSSEASWDVIVSGSKSLAGITVLAGVLVFLVKLPVYGTHLWLPKAHVEAPLVGSMMLAGILLKLGGYGLFLVSVAFDVQQGGVFYFLLCNGVWGGFLASMGALKQVDVKAFVAYSSVTHMGVVVAGTMLNTGWSMNAALITMIAHGVTSSAMFFLAAETAHMAHTRSLSYVAGLVKVFPLLALWWFLMCSINMGCPPTMNFVGEVFLVPSLSQVSTFLVSAFAVSIFMGAVYNFYLFSSLNHGKMGYSVMSGKAVGSSMFTTAAAHSLPMLLVLVIPICF